MIKCVQCKMYFPLVNVSRVFVVFQHTNYVYCNFNNIVSSIAVSMMAIHIPEEDRSLDILELEEHEHLLK